MKISGRIVKKIEATMTMSGRVRSKNVGRDPHWPTPCISRGRRAAHPNVSLPGAETRGAQQHWVEITWPESTVCGKRCQRTVKRN